MLVQNIFLAMTTCYLYMHSSKKPSAKMYELKNFFKNVPG